MHLGVRSPRAMAMQAAFGEIVGGVSVAPERWIAVDTGEANAYGTFASADAAQDWCESKGEEADEYFVTRLLPVAADTAAFRKLTPSEIAAAAGPRVFCPSLGRTVTIPERECPGGCGRYESECKCPQ